MGSPGRFNMEDLGLNLENEEDNDFCRGYGTKTNLTEDDDAYFGMNNMEGEDEEEENDQVPEMPTDFYKNVDTFLSRPPPTLKGSSAPSSMSNKKSKTKEEKEDRAPMFPNIHVKQQDNRMYLPQPPVVIETEVVVSKKKKTKSNKEKADVPSKRPIDNNLLSEAFAYTDKLLREAVIEEQQQAKQQTLMNTNNRAHSTGSVGVGEGSGKYQKGESSNVSVLRKLKNDRQKGYLGSNGSKSGAPSIPKATPSADFNVTGGEGDFVDSRRNIVDFDELVANFESGATLQRLRRELEQSQQSLANSQNHVRNITKDLYKR